MKRAPFRFSLGKMHYLFHALISGLQKLQAWAWVLTNHSISRRNRSISCRCASTRQPRWPRPPLTSRNLLINCETCNVLHKETRHFQWRAGQISIASFHRTVQGTEAQCLPGTWSRQRSANSCLQVIWRSLPTGASKDLTWENSKIKIRFSKPQSQRWSFTLP